MNLNELLRGTEAYWQIEDRRIVFRCVDDQQLDIRYGFTEQLYNEVSAAEFYGILRSRRVLYANVYLETEPIYICLDIMSQGHEYSEWYFIYNYNYEYFLDFFLGKDPKYRVDEFKLDWSKTGF